MLPKVQHQDTVEDCLRDTYALIEKMNRQHDHYMELLGNIQEKLLVAVIEDRDGGASVPIEKFTDVCRRLVDQYGKIARNLGKAYWTARTIRNNAVSQYLRRRGETYNSWFKSSCPAQERER